MLFVVYKGERSPNRCDVVASGVGDHEFFKKLGYARGNTTALERVFILMGTNPML